MPHEYHINSEAGLLTETYAGPITLDVLTKANESIIAHPLFQENLNFLTDLRNARITFRYKEMWAHTLSLPPLHISKQAYIVVRKADFGMIRMFLTLSEDTELYDTAQMFESIEEAMEWLNS